MRHFCIYGNLTIDFIKRPEGLEYVNYGGGPHYSSLPLLEKNVEVELYSVYSPLLELHPSSKYIKRAQYSTQANVFRLEYAGSTRKIYVLSRAPPLYDWNVQLDECYAIVNPVLGEVTVNLLKNVRQRSEILAVDVQGFVRVCKNGEIALKQTTSALAVISSSDIIHADLEELMALVDCYNVNEAAFKASKLIRGVFLVTIRPRKVMLITSENFKVCELQNAYVAVDKTGAGDYFLAAYVYYYVKSNDEIEAIFKAHEQTVKWLKNRDNLRRGLYRIITG